MNTKNILSILFILATIAFSLSSCVKGDFDEPPIIVPKVEFDTVARYDMTIADLLIKYPGTCDSIKDTIIIKGVVTANDESGNLYKAITIQDETAGIMIAINQTSLYVDFRVGERVYIKCRGMYLGRYHNLPQLGFINAGAIGQLPKAYISMHLFQDSLPGKKVEPVVVSPTALNVAMVNKLVRIENVSFADAGSTFSDADASGDRQLEGVGSTFIVRTSNFANFAKMTIPSGSGTIQGILSYYNSTYQLTIRDTNDIIGFKYVKTLFSESFANGLGGFTPQSVSGAQTWTADITYKCAKMSGFSGGNNQNEDWLISPAIDLSSVSAATVRFSHAINKGDVANMMTNHTLWISKTYSSGLPNPSDWVQLTIPTYPSGSSWTYANSGDIAIPAAYLGQSNVRIAFKYLSSTTESATWELQNFKVTE
ncbi:MAG: hypothetical protein HXX13_15450 [Bacteroidetes bacterium]|nr:hypothetical protein [Bacteroidota bacterium]